MIRYLRLLLLIAPLGMPSITSADTPISAVATVEPVVALTFDDGPHPANTPRLLEIFAREGVRVTFFEVGNHVAKHPELARALVAGGHEIGNHTQSHPNLSRLADPAAVRAEIVDAQGLITKTTGIAPRVFRAPFLAHSPAVWAVLAELRLPSITTEVATKDWDAATTREQILETAAKAGPGDIVLMHTWPDKTVEAMPEIISRLRAKGLRFVTVSELLALAPAAPKPGGATEPGARSP